MDSIGDLMKNKPSFNEPPQVRALKAYVKKHHDIDIKVVIDKRYYLLTVPSGAVAQALRFQIPDMTDKCHLDKRLVIHIGY